MVDIDRINEAKTFLVDQGFDVYSATEAQRLVNKVYIIVALTAIGSIVIGLMIGMML